MSTFNENGPDRWNEVREIHRAFWKCEKTGGLIAGTKRTNAFTLSGFELEGSGDRLQPADIHTDSALDWAANLARAGRGFIDGDLVWGLTPLPGIPWVEAMLGCSIQYEKQSGSVWPRPPAQGLGRYIALSSPTGNPWFLKLQEIIRAFVSLAQSTFPVTQPLMQGISDILAAILGYERFCLGFVDHEEETCELMAKVADYWIDLATRAFDAIPPFDGGYPAPRLEVWAPGRLIRIEEDATILVSPEIFRDFFVPFEKNIFRHFDFSIIHTHSANAKILRHLREVDELSAIQVLIDPGGPDPDDLVKELRAIQDNGKALLITHQLGDADARRLASELSPNGLAMERMS